MLINFPISNEEFKKEYFEQKPLVMKKAIKEEDLLSWKSINEIFPRLNLMSDEEIKLMYKSQKTPKGYYIEGYDDLGTWRYKFKEEALYHFMRDGATLVANGIVNEPSTDIFSQEIAAFTKCHTFTSLYIAFNTQSSFKSHWDSRDIFAVQMRGKKRWIIHAPTFQNPLYMHKSKDMPEYNPNFDDVYMDIILEAGDVLYLPRGWWHDPLPVGEETVHLAVGIFPAYANNYLTWVAQNMVEKEIARKSLFSYEENKDIIDELGNATAEYIRDKSNYTKFIESFYDRKRIEKPLNLEIFADCRNNTIPKDSVLAFKTQNNYFDENNKIISNGYGITIDEKFKKIIHYMQERGNTDIDDVLRQFDEEDRNKVSELIWHLSYIGVIKVN